MTYGVLLCLWSVWASADGSQPIPDSRPITVAAVPLINFTTDRGIGLGGYGAMVYTHPDGAGDAPYTAQIGTQFYRTTGGYQDHKLVIDLPRLAEGRIRADFHVGLESWDGALYFGQGNALPRLRPEDTPIHFYEYGLNSFRVVSEARTPISERFDLFFGQLARSGTIQVYPGSRLDIDQPDGIEGGWLSQAHLGLIYDTRDHEFAPSDGAFTELSIRGAHPWLGSSWSMWGVNFTDRHYWTLGETEIVLATREAIDIQRGEVPFFHQNVMGGSEWVDIGGRAAMRGLPIGRYRGDMTLYGDAELRWGVHRFVLRRGNLKLFLVSLIGGARIIQPGENTPGLGIHGGAGGGIRLLYNEVFLARIDIAAGLEEYTSPNAPLATSPHATGWIPGVYIAFSAPY